MLNAALQNPLEMGHHIMHNEIKYKSTFYMMAQT